MYVQYNKVGFVRGCVGVVCVWVFNGFFFFIIIIIIFTWALPIQLVPDEVGRGWVSEWW